MGAHTAPRTTTVGRIAGRGALTAAAALALTGGTASFAFAGVSSDEGSHHKSAHECESTCGEKSWDDEHWNKSDDVDADRKSDEGCDEDEDRGRHHDWDDEDDDHGKRGKKHDEDDDHGKWGKKHDRDGQFGARYEKSKHIGDDYYTVNNVTKSTGLLDGVL